jgi:MFS family permease
MRGRSHGLDGLDGLDGLWRNANFLKLWAGQTVSLFGSQVTALALPLAAILTLHATPAQVGILRAAEFAPFLLITLFAGVWVDRRRRRPILIAVDLGRAAALGLIPVAALLGLLRVEYLYAIAFGVGMLTVLFDLAYQAFLPSLARPDEMIEANSKLQVSGSVAQIAGPGLAGLLVQAVTAPVAILVDAISFLVSAAALWRIRAGEIAPAASPGRQQGVWREIRRGLRFVFGEPRLRAMAGEAATSNFFGTAIETVLILYAIRELGMQPAVFGVTIAAGSVGALLGALLAEWGSQRFGLGPALMCAYALVCASPLLNPLVQRPFSVAVALLLLAQFLAGIGLSASNVYVISLRQTLAPGNFFGRVNASYRFFVSGAVPLGALLAGYLGETIGLRATLAVCACGMLVAPLWALLSPLPRLRQLPAVADGIQDRVAHGVDIAADEGQRVLE